MVSDKPLPDRCAATITDKVGLEVELSIADDSSVVTDETIDAVRLTKDDATVDAPAAYGSVREHLWDGYETTHLCVPAGDDSLADAITERAVDLAPPSLAVDNPVSYDTETHVWIDVSDVVVNTKNRTSVHKGYCEKYPMRDAEHGRCYTHQGGGAPEGNGNAIKHGMYAQRTTFYQSLDEEDKQFIEALVDSWIQNAPFDRDNVAMVNELYRCGIDQLRAWSGIDEMVEDGSYAGLVKEQEVFDGEEVHEIEEEHPANLPYSRLDNDIRSKLKDIGVYDSPEAQQADATESLAKKLSGLSDSDA